ncbi:MFS transporter [Albibacterium bauzanense]|uniref:Putative MFS family arabinose efflux permease n=1 Tax=Albibacterium bauzanense TaxID=653929 RepID=A0A4R1M2N9_9SPHI|nr:MFS transporter [Albibacterium bauzanense]TCK85290.1 putative MFS family arabinose efflux permease [Albibacterium bauzanense]
MKNHFQIYLNAYRGLSQPAWMLSLVMLINRMGAMVIPFLGLYMTEHLHFSLKETGIVLSFFGLGAISGSYIGGRLTDINGHFKIQLLSLCLTVPLFFLLPALKTPLLLSIGIFILSLIAETFRPANSVSIAYYAKPQNLTRALSLNRMALNLGFSIGPAVGGLLAAFSYNWLFYGNGISAALAGFVFYIYFRRREGNQKLIKQNNSQRIQILPLAKSPYKDKAFIIFNILCTFYSICFFQLLSTLPLYYKQEYILEDSAVGIILAFNGLVVFLLEMFLVHIAEKKLTSFQTITLGAALLSISFLLLINSAGVWILFLSMFILSVSEIFVFPFTSTVTLKRAHISNQGAYMGLNGLAFSAAHILSPSIGTQIVSAFGFDILWLSTAVLAFISTIGFYLIRNKFNTPFK